MSKMVLAALFTCALGAHIVQAGRPGPAEAPGDASLLDVLQAVPGQGLEIEPVRGGEHRVRVLKGREVVSLRVRAEGDAFEVRETRRRPAVGRLRAAFVDQPLTLAALIQAVEGLVPSGRPVEAKIELTRRGLVAEIEVTLAEVTLELTLDAQTGSVLRIEAEDDEAGDDDDDGEEDDDD